MVCGVLFDQMNVPQDTAAFRINTDKGLMTFWFPQRNGNVRTYVVYQADSDYRLSGKKDVRRFIEESINAGGRGEEYDGANAIGPLASFEGADNWVEHPYKNGVALVGDAAAASDASWGEGLSLTLRDARVLCENLLATEDWDDAGHAYAEQHDQHYKAVHTVGSWLSDVFMDASKAGIERRARVMPLIAQDMTRIPDFFALGPDTPCDEAARRRFFGEH